MIAIDDTATIYVACPGNYATGGPELLHQLCHELRKSGFDSKMYYYHHENPDDPVHPEFKKYQCPWTVAIQPTSKDALIVPECDTWLARYYRGTRIVMWWLSVDYYFKSLHKPLIEKLKNLRRGRVPIGTLEAIKKRSFEHLAQSRYAMDFLKRNGIESGYLSDYLNEDILAEASKVDIRKKENIVAYNPRKGFEFTSQLIVASPTTRFIPIEKMSRQEVIALLAKSKVYIDFGEHPGKDRIPREAAMLGCCVITGRRGAAAFDGDLPIPSGYKFEDRAQSIPAILDTINACLSDYPKRTADFEAYRAVTKAERAFFVESVSACFMRKAGGV